MSPELIKNEGDKQYTQKVDIWALGIFAIELDMGEPPHIDLSVAQILYKILDNDTPKL